MAYSDFTLRDVTKQFHLTLSEPADMFAEVPPVAPGEALATLLKASIPVAEGINTEKARSVFIVAPILLEIRRLLHEQISVFSGIDFNIDPVLGLKGTCDFVFGQIASANAHESATGNNCRSEKRQCQIWTRSMCGDDGGCSRV